MGRRNETATIQRSASEFSDVQIFYSDTDSSPYDGEGCKTCFQSLKGGKPSVIPQTNPIPRDSDLAQSKDFDLADFKDELKDFKQYLRGYGMREFKQDLEDFKNDLNEYTSEELKQYVVAYRQMFSIGRLDTNTNPDTDTGTIAKNNKKKIFSLICKGNGKKEGGAPLASDDCLEEEEWTFFSTSVRPIMNTNSKRRGKFRSIFFKTGRKEPRIVDEKAEGGSSCLDSLLRAEVVDEKAEGDPSCLDTLLRVEAPPLSSRHRSILKRSYSRSSCPGYSRQYV